MRNIKGKALDLGCGDGKVLKILVKKLPNLRFVGIDRKKIKADFEFVRAKGENLPFANRYFDAVTSFEVLEHVDNLDVVLKEIKRVLKPNGVFYFTTPLEGDKKNLYGFLNQKRRYDPHRKNYGHIQKYTTQILMAALNDNGFRIKKVTYTAHYINQVWTLFLNRINKKLTLLTFFVNFLAGIESLLFRKSPWGLDIQVTSIKI